MSSTDNKKYPHQDRSLKDREGEEWDDIPSLDGAYRISNYGRIKSLRRWVERTRNGGFWVSEKTLRLQVSEKIISAGKRRLYRLTTVVNFEGKRVNIQIARLVYYLFVGKFKLEDRRLVVSFKDENPLNICPENLILTTPGKNITKAYQKKYRPRDSFGNKAQLVSQYDLKGNWVCTYLSMSQAAKITGIEPSGICDSLNQKSTYAGGSLWRFGSDKRKIKTPQFVKEKLESEKFHSQIVNQYDLQGNKVKEYLNLKEAAKAIKIQPGRIRYVILGRRLSAKNFYWTLGKGPDKISLKHIEKKKKQGKEKICRQVTQYDLQGKKVRTYPSLAEAARKHDIPSTNIFSVLKRNANSITNGFIWRYGDGPERIKLNSDIKRKIYLQQLFQKPVTQYDKNGIRVAQYDTLLKAAKAVNGQIHDLRAIVEGKRLRFQGYFWRLGKGGPEINVNKANESLQTRFKVISKPVVQYTKEGKMVKEFESMCAASRATNTSEGQIRKVALGQYKLAKGFSWKFK